MDECIARLLGITQKFSCPEKREACLDRHERVGLSYYMHGSNPSNCVESSMSDDASCEPRELPRWPFPLQPDASCIKTHTMSRNAVRDGNDTRHVSFSFFFLVILPLQLTTAGRPGYHCHQRPGWRGWKSGRVYHRQCRVQSGKEKAYGLAGCFLPSKVWPMTFSQGRPEQTQRSAGPASKAIQLASKTKSYVKTKRACGRACGKNIRWSR